MNNSKEIRIGSDIWFCKESDSAFVSTMRNNKRYFVSKVNSAFLTEESDPIKNGEHFFVTGVRTIKELNYTTVLTICREKDRKDLDVRWEDIFNFCTK